MQKDYVIGNIKIQCVENTNIRNLKYSLFLKSGITSEEKNFKKIEAVAKKYGLPTFMALRVKDYSRNKSINNFRKYVRVDSSNKRLELQDVLKKIKKYQKNPFLEVSEADIYQMTYDTQLIYEYDTQQFQMENIFARLLDNAAVKALIKKPNYATLGEFKTLYEICRIKLPYLEEADLLKLCDYMKNPAASNAILYSVLSAAETEITAMNEAYADLSAIKIPAKLMSIKGNLGLSLVEYKMNLDYPVNNLFLDRLFYHFPLSKEIPFMKLNLGEDNRYYFKTHTSLKQENAAFIQDWFGQIKSTKKTEAEEFITSNNRLQWKILLEKDPNTNRNRYSTVTMLANGTMEIACMWNIDASVHIQSVDFIKNICVANLVKLVAIINSTKEAFRLNEPIKPPAKSLVVDKINCTIIMPMRYDFAQLEKLAGNFEYLGYFMVIKRKKEGSKRGSNYIKYQIISFPSTFESPHETLEDLDVTGISVTFQDSFQAGFSNLRITGASSPKQIQYIYDFILRLSTLYLSNVKKAQPQLQMDASQPMDLISLLKAAQKQQQQQKDAEAAGETDDIQLAEGTMQQKKVTLTAQDKKNIANFSQLDNQHKLELLFPTAPDAPDDYTRQCQKKRPTVYTAAEFKGRKAMTDADIKKYEAAIAGLAKKGSALTNAEVKAVQLKNKGMYTYAIKYPNPQGHPQFENIYLVCDNLGGTERSSPQSNLGVAKNIYLGMNNHGTPCCYTTYALPPDFYPNVIPQSRVKDMPKKKFSATKDYIKQTVSVLNPDNYGILPDKLNTIFNNKNTVDAMLKEGYTTDNRAQPFLQLGVVGQNPSVFLHAYYAVLDTKAGETYRQLDFGDKSIKYINVQRQKIGEKLTKELFMSLDKNLWEPQMKVFETFKKAVSNPAVSLNEKYWWQLLGMIHGVQPILFSIHEQNIVCTIRRDIQNVYNKWNKFAFIAKIEYTFQPIIWLTNKNTYTGVFEYAPAKYNIINLVFRLYTSICSDELLSFKNLLYPVPMLHNLTDKGMDVVGQIVQSKHVVFLVAKSGDVPILIPVVPGIPLQLPMLPLKSAMNSAQRMIAGWKKLDAGIKINSQVVVGGKVIGVKINGGIFVPCLPSAPIKGIPQVADLNYSRINANILKGNMLASRYLEHTTRQQYENELYERFRFELSRYLIDRDCKNRAELQTLLNSGMSKGEKMEKLEKLLDPILRHIIVPLKERSHINVSDIPSVRQACFYNVECKNDVFCRPQKVVVLNTGSQERVPKTVCKLGIFKDDLVVFRQKLFLELMHNDLRTEEILEGLVNIYNREDQHINFDVKLGRIGKSKEEVIQNLYGQTAVKQVSDVSSFVTHFPKDNTIPETAAYDEHYILPYQSPDGKYILQNVPMDYNNLYKAVTNAMEWLESGRTKMPGYFGTYKPNERVNVTQDNNARALRKDVFTYLKTQVKDKTPVKHVIDELVAKYHPYENTMGYIRRIKFNAVGNEPSEVELWALAQILGKKINIFDQRMGYTKPVKSFEPMDYAKGTGNNIINLYYSKRNQYNVMYTK